LTAAHLTKSLALVQAQTQATSFPQVCGWFEEKDAQDLGISCDTAAAHRA
jgi:peroxiredoxin